MLTNTLQGFFVHSFSCFLTTIPILCFSIIFFFKIRTKVPERDLFYIPVTRYIFLYLNAVNLKMNAITHFHLYNWLFQQIKPCFFFFMYTHLRKQATSGKENSTMD